MRTILYFRNHDGTAGNATTVSCSADLWGATLVRMTRIQLSFSRLARFGRMFDPHDSGYGFWGI